MNHQVTKDTKKARRVCWKCGYRVPKDWKDAGFGRTTSRVDGKIKSDSFTCPDCSAKANVVRAGWKRTNILPDSDITVMVFHPDWDEPIWVGYHDGEEWLWVDGATCDPQPTHWMDFPEPPQPSTITSQPSTIQ